MMFLDLNISTALEPFNTIKVLLVRVKDPTPPQSRVGIVHGIPCAGCNAACVGQTERTVQHRIKEYKYATHKPATNCSLHVLYFLACLFVCVYMNCLCTCWLLYMEIIDMFLLLLVFVMPWCLVFLRDQVCV